MLRQAMSISIYHAWKDSRLILCVQLLSECTHGDGGDPEINLESADISSFDKATQKAKHL